ncbi:hypothetical protein COT97_00660 [Candidatus Falkowbacteria bacterium CG10_big_fil_rev_8_21_14_0_10_39_11]|uniref:Uncharacterized protein n=1 Tax=Candidatus Falkowbacteria bacterium CG10_big_fil_rev_8_21_14_0_10_39_11 TaxID=1974565 RepID=A0A2H0V651_9BACT|nr:MAG: hypothetical protein COT97_00660 [Candidatus Falkowbacteria bacterium CG10_big_fil_rev_8_21_14_0_10_39_11]
MNGGLNGNYQWYASYFFGLSLSVIGEKIGEVAKTSDGNGLRVELCDLEEMAFVAYAGLNVGYSIADLICDAIEKKTGQQPVELKYVYANMVFTT